MLNLIQGETVTVIERKLETDELGDVVNITETSREVANVVVAPSSVVDLSVSRPNGKETDLTLGFPKGEAVPADAHIIVRGNRYRVVGEPFRYTSVNILISWDLTVKCERVGG